MKKKGKKISEWMKGRGQRILLSFFAFILLTACTSGGSMDSSDGLSVAEEQENDVDTSEISENAEAVTDTSEISENAEDAGDVSETSEGAEDAVGASGAQQQKSTYTFRKARYLTEHFKKHGAEMGAKSEEAYLEMANAVIDNPDALHKLEADIF